MDISTAEWPIFENDYQRYIYYKESAENMGRAGMIPVKAAQAVVAYYAEKALTCEIPSYEM